MGIFDNAWFKCEDTDSVFRLVSDSSLRDMEDFLRSRGNHDAADEVFQYRIFLESHHRQIMAYGRRISGLLFASEKWANGDTDGQPVNQAIMKMNEGL